MSDQTIETIFVEDRRYPPPPEFAALAVAQPDVYEREFDEFWESEGRERVTWFEPFTQALRVGAALREVVSRREAQRLVQLRRPPRRGGPRRPSRLPLGGRAGRRPPRAHLRPAPVGGRPLRECAQGARRRQGDEGRDLHGHGPGAPGGDARLHAPGRAPHGRLRRLLGRLALGPRQRHGLRGADHAGRGVAAWHDRSAQADSRCGDGGCAGNPALPRRAAHRQRGADARRPRLLAARARGLRRPRRLPARADGRGGPALPHVHVRYDGEAEGDRAHDRRLPRRRRLDPRADLRPEAGGRRLLVRGRHRLDHRPQLHRLRAADERRHLGALRGDAGLPGQGSLVGDRRALRRHDPLHGADRDQGAHEVGAGARGQARALDAAAARVGRRADQPGGVDVVPRACRRRPLPGRRHVVADRDGHDHDHAVAGRDNDEAGLGDEAVPRCRGGGLQRGGRGGRPRRRRLPGAQAALAGDDARDLRRRRALPARRTGRSTPASTSPATAPGSTRTATTGCSGASTT